VDTRQIEEPAGSASPDHATREPFFDLVAAEDPAPLLHRLRAEDPVHFVAPLGFWLVTRHDDVKRLFNDPENVTQNRRAWEHYAPPPEGTLVRWIQEESLMTRSEADHAPIPNTVISRIVGVQAGADEVRFRELAQEMIRAFFPFAPPEAMTRAEAALHELAPWVRRMVVERRQSLREDLISDLLRAQGKDDGIEDDEIVMLISLLIGAGSETTNLGGLVIIQTLLAHPEQLERVREDRSLVPRAVNEIMRFAFGGPAGMQRFAVRDFSLRGRSIRKGQMLMLSFGGANRDPAVFPNPDALDLERDNRDLLVFGSGPHYCLGANLARQEMGCMLDAALDIVAPGSRLREDLQRFEPLGIFQRPVNLPIEIAG